MKTDPTKMPDNPEERTEDEFRTRMHARRERNAARDRVILEDLEYYRKSNRNLVLGSFVLFVIYSAIVIYFMST